MLNTASETVESLHLKMDETASTLPEYPVVMAMNGVGSTLGPQLMAEIGDVTRFTHRGARTALPALTLEKTILVNISRRACLQQRKVSPTCIRPFSRSWTASSSVPLLTILFMLLWIRNGRRASLITFNMAAGANKFLRIYYGRVKEYLSMLAEAEKA